MTLPPSDWRARASLRMLVELLGGGATTKLVGGAVRDSLLGLPVNDIDLATRLLPDDVVARLEAAKVKAVPTGLAHGTVTAVIAGGPVEVTTLRRDVATDGRRATVEFSEDWQADAARRDFTINALYADVATGDVEDWFGGLDDLDARQVRFIGDPLTRIAEDHLRILRFFRFHARFGLGEPDAAGLAACTARANDLMALSRERIAAELLKLLATADPAPTLAIMIDHGILAAVIPEFDDAAPLARCVVREAELGVAGDPVRRLAALIGDRRALAQSLGGRLKLSNAQAKRLLVASEAVAGSPEALAYRLGTEGAIDQIVLREGTAVDVAALTGWTRPTLPISGGGLIERGLEPGPVVAATLAKIEQDWIAAGFPEGAPFDAIVERALRGS